MNKDILIKKGWIFQNQYGKTLYFQKGDIWVDDGGGGFLEFNLNDFKMKLITTDKSFDFGYPKSSIKFNGYCETEQEYDFIYKMLRLKI